MSQIIYDITSALKYPKLSEYMMNIICIHNEIKKILTTEKISFLGRKCVGNLIISRVPWEVKSSKQLLSFISTTAFLYTRWFKEL